MTDIPNDLPEPIDSIAIVAIKPEGPISKDYKESQKRKDLVASINKLRDDMSAKLSRIHRSFRKFEQVFMGEGLQPIMPELPAVVGMLIHRHCSVAAAKLETAIMNSGAFLNYIPADSYSRDSAERVTRFIERYVKDVPGNMRHVRHWFQATPKFGTSFMCIEPQFGNVPVGVSEESKHEIKEFGNRFVAWRYVQPDCILVDPEIIDIADQPVVIETRLITRKDILYKSKTGEWDKDAATEAYKHTGGSDGMNPERIGTGHPFYDELSQKDNEKVRVTTAWYPDGYKITVVSDTYLVEARKTIHTREHGGAPYVPLFYSIDSGMFYGVPLTWKILSDQKELNDSRSLAMYAKVSALYPMLLYNASALHNRSDLERQKPGKTIPVNGDPRQVAFDFSPPIGNYQAAAQDTQMIIRNAEYNDGISDNVLGNVAGGRTPTGTERIRNANAHSEIDAIVQDNIDNIIRLGEITLLVTKDLIDQDGLNETHVQSRSGDWFHVMEEDFTAAIMTKAGVDTNKINPDVAIANAQAWFTMAAQSMNLGARLDPKFVERTLRYVGEVMNIPVDSLLGTADTMREAMGDINKIENGVPAIVSKNSDHLTHIVIELPYMLSTTNPSVREALNEHIAVHVFELQEYALQIGDIKEPIYDSYDHVMESIRAGQTQEFEDALGVQFFPSNQQNAFAAGMNMPVEAAMPMLQGGVPGNAGQIMG